MRVLILALLVLLDSVTSNQVDTQGNNDDRNEALLEAIEETLERREEDLLLKSVLEKMVEKAELGKEALSVAETGDVVAVPKPVLIPPPSPCCNKEFAFFDLTTGQIKNTNGAGVTIFKPPQSQSSGLKCAIMTVLKINFEKITAEPCPLIDGCLKGPYCGRRMLRIDLQLSAERSGYMFNVGDSESNDAFKGDASHQTNDAEIDGIFPNVFVRSSDLCNKDSSLNTLAVYNDAIASPSVSRITLYVSDKHVRITNDNGLDKALCHKCLFALNGQPDAQGPENEDIYLGLNRVIRHTSRKGVGVCSATLTWVCPW